MVVKFEHLQDTVKYKKALKAQVKALTAEPAEYRYFEKFRFKDDTLGPLMLVGEMAKKSLFDAVKNTNALIVSKGQCAAGASGIEFAPKMGKLKLVPTLKAAMGNPPGAAVVKELSTIAAPAPLEDSKLEAKANSVLKLLTKQFDSIKGRMMDEERKKLRIRFGKVQDLMTAGEYGDAIKAMKALEQDKTEGLARVGSEIREDARKGGAKSSIFLNPVVEKEAVDRAKDIASKQCEWTEWKDGATWKPILSLTIVVPPPKSALGYGLATERVTGFVKKSATAAAAELKKFEDGKLTIDALMKNLDVQLKPDKTGVGAAMVRHARVVLKRGSVNDDWSNKTQFPTDDPSGWEAAKNKSLTGKPVRGPNIAETVAPAYTA